MVFKNYKHYLPIQIRFVDIDRLNHVNNSCYLNYFELGRVNYFNVVLNSNINWNTHGFVLARTEINHLEPIFLTDEIVCCTRISKIGTKSVTIENSILKKENNGNYTECSNGLGILVAMNYTTQQSIELPYMWRNLINDFEKL